MVCLKPARVRAFRRIVPLPRHGYDSIMGDTTLSESDSTGPREPGLSLPGHVRLSLKTYFGSASLHVDAAVTHQGGNHPALLNMLCNLHHYARAIAGVEANAFPELAIHVENFGPFWAFHRGGLIAMTHAQLRQANDACAAGRVSYALTYALGKVILHYMGLDSAVVCPEPLQGLAQILGLQVCEYVDMLPQGNCRDWTSNGDYTSTDQFRDSLIQNGLVTLDGIADRLLLDKRNNTEIREILGAAVADLTYNRLRTDEPLRHALSVLSKYAKSDAPGESATQQLERFFEAFGTSAGFDVSAYLRAWKIPLDNLAAKLAHLPPLDASLPMHSAPPGNAVDAVTNAADEKAKRALERRPEAAFSQVGIEAIVVALGPEIAPDFLSEVNGEKVLDRFNDLRREIARETGIVMPGVHFRDDIYLEPLEYRIYVRDEFCGKGSLPKDQVLVLGNQAVLAQLTGDEIREPVYGLKAKWIPAGEFAAAKALGGMAFDPLSVLASHAGQVVRDNLSLLLGRQEFHALLEHLRGKVPMLIKDIEASVSTYVLHKAYHLLLRECIWPRDPVRVFETFLDVAQSSKDPAVLAEAARKHAVPLQLTRKKWKSITAASLDPAFERACCAADGGGAALTDPNIASYLADEVKKYVAVRPVNEAYILCTPAFRAAFAAFVLRLSIKVAVYAFDEIPAELGIEIDTVILPPAIDGGTVA